MKILIAVKSCKKAWMAGEHNTIRNTWGRYVPKNIDLIFFMGDKRLFAADLDEVVLDVPDDYYDLPKKVKAIARWALENKYDFVYFCDNDTFINPKALLESGFQKYDYSGHFWTFGGDNIGSKGTYKYFHGGYGYWLGKEGLKIIDNAIVGEAKHEEVWVVKELYAHKLKIGTLPKFSYHYPKDHYPSPRYSAKFPWQEMMTQYHIRKEEVKDRTWEVPISGFNRTVQFNLHHTDKA